MSVESGEGERPGSRGAQDTSSCQTQGPWRYNQLRQESIYKAASKKGILSLPGVYLEDVSIQELNASVVRDFSNHRRLVLDLVYGREDKK